MNKQWKVVIRRRNGRYLKTEVVDSRYQAKLIRRSYDESYFVQVFPLNEEQNESVRAEATRKR